MASAAADRLVLYDRGMLWPAAYRPHSPTNTPTNKVCRGDKPPKSAETAHSALVNGSPRTRRTSVRPRPLFPPSPQPAACSGFDADPRLGRGHQSRPRQKRARSDASARSLPHTAQPRTARLRGRQRRRRVRGDNKPNKDGRQGRPSMNKLQFGGTRLVQPYGKGNTAGVVC